MSTTNTPATSADTTPASLVHHHPPPRRGSIRASGSLWGWRTVDLLTVTFLGAAFGVAYWAWGLAYTAPRRGLEAIFPPLQGIAGAPWLMAGVVGGLVIRRPAQPCCARWSRPWSR